MNQSEFKASMLEAVKEISTSSLAMLFENEIDEIDFEFAIQNVYSALAYIDRTRKKLRENA